MIVTHYQENNYQTKTLYTLLVQRNTGMGKSAKKKRQKERQRQDRLSQLSTFGALNLSSNNSSQSIPSTSNSTSTTKHQFHSPNELCSDDVSDSEADAVQPNEKIPMTSAPSSRSKSPSKSFTIDEFGSSSNRVRTLPLVEFVYPRNDSGSGRHKTQEPKLYEFGRTDEEQSGNTDIQSANHVVVKSKESIDDILYQKTNQSNESNGTNDEVDKTNDSDNINTRKPSSTITPKSTVAETPRNTLPQRQTEVMHQLPYLSRISVEEAVRDKAGLRPRANSTDGELKLPQRGLCDERNVLECYKWTSSIGASMATPKGFNNLGNTCFLNSTLQCLAYCPPLCQLLMNMPRGDDVVPNGSGKKINQGKMFTLMLAALFRRVHNADNAKGALSPRKIVSALPLLGSGSTRRNGYKFRPGRQEDAHEFLVHLLDAMNDGELREAGINANKAGWRDRLPVPRLDETTFVHRIFGGYLRSQVRCTDCGYRSNTYDPFMDLSLEISRNSCHSLSSAFSEFTRKETLDSQNRWKCSGCKKRVCATKQLTVFRPPLALCVQLKRFTFGGSFSGFHGGGKKISKAIEFPVQLQLPLSDGRSCGYVLTGIVIHIGGSASSGHYTAYVQRPSTNGDRKWFHMDDSFVQSVSEQHVLRQHNAYVVMYSRQEVKIEFPTPPLRGSMTTDEAKELALSRQKEKSSKTSETTTNNNNAAVDEALDGATEALQSDQSFVLSSRSRITSATSIKSVPIFNGLNRSTEPSLNSSIVDATEGQINGMNTIVDASKARKGTCEQNERNTDIRMNGTTKNSNRNESFSETTPLASRFQGQDSLLELAAKAQPSMDQSSPKVDAAKYKSNLSTVSGDRGDGGKVEVIVRSQLKKQRAWIPKTVQAQTDEEFVLLGNIPVGKWDDDDNLSEVIPNGHVRTKIAKDMKTGEQDRKRKMFLDRHDAMLDHGKVC